MSTVTHRRMPSCCGIHDISGVSWITDTQINQLLTEFKIGGGGFGQNAVTFPAQMYVFADMYTPKTGRTSMYAGRGQALAHEIEKRKIGVLTEAPKFYNPNSSNICKAWFWYLSQEEIDRVLKEEAEKKVKLDKEAIDKAVQEKKKNEEKRAETIGRIRRAQVRVGNARARTTRFI